MNQIRAEIEKSDSDYDREKLQERPAKLAGGVAVIKVGRPPRSSSLKERKHRIEGTPSATPARPVEEGIVPGGGVGSCRRPSRPRGPSTFVGDEAGTGANIVLSRRSRPRWQIAVNAGLEGGVVAEKVRGPEAGEGLNAATGEYVDMIDAGIIDPAKVTRSAIAERRPPSRRSSSPPRPSSPTSPKKRRPGDARGDHDRELHRRPQRTLQPAPAANDAERRPASAGRASGAPDQALRPRRRRRDRAR